MSTGGGRDVVLVAHPRLSTSYVRAHYEILAADERLRFFITQAPDGMNAGVQDAIDHLVADSDHRVTPIPFERAVRRDWDLALFGTHGSRERFGDDVPCIHIQHGIGAGKQVLDDDFTYGRLWAIRQDGPRMGEPLYAAMLESSYTVRDRAVRRVPELADRIRVVGDVFADRLLEADSRRDEFRDLLGIRAEQTAVLFISTWGDHGLMGGDGGAGLPRLRAAAALGDRYATLLSMHPHLWHADGVDGPRLWRQRLNPLADSGLIVCGPDESWAPYLAAADVAIIDHSSLCLYYGILERPSIAVPVQGDQINPAAPIAALRAASPLLRDPADLRATLHTALSTFDQRLVPGRDRIVAHPGASATRIAAVLYDILSLDPPDQIAAVRAAGTPTPFPLREPSARAASTPTSAAAALARAFPRRPSPGQGPVVESPRHPSELPPTPGRQPRPPGR
ncbi:CDP-glycerol glycerophosphotransferase family protein [Frankia sp. AiPs1]|uniref:CDP-glycerol glycerophosphotransferase family protein n=1 Tax=Frankia sp. AiPs1 TaxID=573493 RepID=UPI0020430509|nr:CDP-glycerol glycerophosphotransferase family protein [Frankia sp. AiPs1]MCM3921547.1 CDP-glycerol glycerophosphotransferase family protein [Frankia sp. AiPs1]